MRGANPNPSQGAPPEWVLREVTDLPQWQGGDLAAAQAIPES